MQLASLFDYFPSRTEQQADLVIKDINDRMDAFLHPSDLVLDEDQLCDAVGPAVPDPYVHCLLSLFQSEMVSIIVNWASSELTFPATPDLGILGTIWMKPILLSALPCHCRLQKAAG
jgi:hypothetical protein